jgi:hypothetical protein
MEDLRRTIAQFVHRDELVLQLKLAGRQAMSSDNSGLIEEARGSDMVKMLMGQDDEVYVPGGQAHLAEICLQLGKAPTGACVDEHILTQALDQVDMTSRRLRWQKEYVRAKFCNLWRTGSWHH